MANLKQTIRNSLLFSCVLSFYRRYFANRRSKFGYIHPTAFVRLPTIIKGIENVYMYEHTHLLSNSMILSTRAKFIMKKYSGAAEGLTVVTGNHFFIPGKSDATLEKPAYADKDVIIEDSVWIASNVTILSGVTVGRGAILGAGCVCRKNIPPYAIVVGNPAKVVGFKFTPEEVIEHEKVFYPEEERLPYELLEKNYRTYFIKKIKDIKQYIN